MKKIILILIAFPALIVSCNPKEETKTTGKTTSSVEMPYKASYSTDFNSDVPDSMLLMALNTYKYWESGDMNALRATMGDSMSVYGADGFKFIGLTDSLMPKWKAVRDSISTVAITMDVWLKNHSLKDSIDYVNVWYKEIDTYKNGKVDSAYFEDDNGIKNGKLIWFSSHRQELKPKK